MFYKPEYENVNDHNEENIDITKIESKDIDIIAIYRGQNGSLDCLIRKMQNIIDLSKSTLIIGDINICNYKMEQNELRKFMEEKNFKKIINKASHIDGRHINHAYILNVGNFVETPEIELLPKYYSDHDSVCVTWKKLDQQIG